MTLEAVMAQLQYMDARLDKLSEELCQVNTYVGCIARRQAHLGGFVESPSPSLEASEDEDSDFDNDNDDEDEDEDVSSPSDDEMPTWFTYPLSLMTKRGSSFDMRVIIYSLRPIFFVLFEKSNFLREHHLLSCLPFKNV